MGELSARLSHKPFGSQTNSEQTDLSVLHPCCTEQTVLGRNPL